MPRHHKIIKPLVKTFRNSCDVKRRFTSEKAAQEAAEFRMLEHMTLDLEVYHCMECHGWHLTRKQS